MPAISGMKFIGGSYIPHSLLSPVDKYDVPSAPPQPLGRCACLEDRSGRPDVRAGWGERRAARAGGLRWCDACCTNIAAKAWMHMCMNMNTCR